MKKEKRFSESKNRGTGNGRVIYSTEAPKNPQHGDEWIDQSVEFTTVPTSISDTGTPGQFAADANYLYVCYAVDSWFRIPKGSW